MSLSRLALVILACRDACSSLPHAFKRKRIFDEFSLFMSLMMLCAVKKSQSYLEVMRQMEVTLSESCGWSHRPSASALSQARGKLPASSCRGIWLAALAAVRPLFARDAERRVFGLRPVAVDGTSTITPHEASTKARWPQPKLAEGRLAHHPQALLVIAFELFSRLPIGLAVMGHKASEHLGLRELLGTIGRNNLLILDRGYLGKALLRDMIASGNQVVLRMTTAEANCWDCVYQFVRAKGKDSLVELVLPCRPGHVEEPLTVIIRLIARSFPRGRPGRFQGREKMVLLTTLTDAERAPREDLIALYSARWGIETFNREIKTIYQVERFRSRTAERVEQELYACLTWLTIAAAAQSAVDQAIRRVHGAQRWNDPTRIQVRRTYLFTIVTDWFQQLMAGTVTPEGLLDAMADDIADLVRYAAKRRPGRSESRVRKHPNGRTKVK
jgi:hypothetical protein